MTNNILACLTGATLAAAELASGSAGTIESITQLGGLGVLVWIALRQSKELDKLREQLRESYRKCGDCALARAANNNLIEQAEHEREDKADSEKTGRAA